MQKIMQETIMKGDLSMLSKIMWNIFKETGNIYAYLYVMECNRYCYNKNDENSTYTKKTLEMKEITIMT